MLEALLAHLDTAATNGSAAAEEAPAADKTAESADGETKKDEAAPAEVSLLSCLGLVSVMTSAVDLVPVQRYLYLYT